METCCLVYAGERVRNSLNTLQDIAELTAEEMVVDALVNSLVVVGQVTNRKVRRVNQVYRWK